MNQTIAPRAPQRSAHAKTRNFALIFATLIAAIAFCFPNATHVAWANDGSDASVACELSDADRQAYEADGTLDARVAYMQSLETDSTDPGLIAQAQARESGAVATYNATSVPSSWKTGMPTTGTARVLAVCVQFPDGVNVFEDIEAERASLETMFNGGAGSQGALPYDSLRAYYTRSSYGKLDITCGAVLAYTAAYPRDHYASNPNELFYEVAKAIDDNPDVYGVDLGEFDGNNDGVLDGLYVLFAGENTGWGSSWWPAMRHFSYSTEGAQPTFGHTSHKVTLDASVLLDKTQADATDDRQPTCTLIHETGHVLGLPDYYHYDSAGSQSSARGLGVFDMMNSSQGDHNAFSKWLLGWIDDESITRVRVSENGVKAVRGSQTFEAEGTLEQTLQAFDNANISETGGFIAVSNSDDIFTTLFGSFYLLQYDQYAGNQSLMVTTDQGEAPMRSGLRAFRVQAALNQSGSNFVKSNSSATSQHDQLIESLDPSDDKVTPIAFGNFFDEGRVISPSSAPSTNFMESVDFGYTGIQIAVGASETSQGTVGISYAEKPEAPEFGISAGEGFQLTEAGAFTLDMSQEARIASTVEPWPATDEPVLYVDGEPQPNALGYKFAAGTKFTFNLTLETGTLRNDSVCQLVFPEGYFAIGEQAGQTVYSKQITVGLPVAPLTEIESSGVYENLDAAPNASIAMSNAYATANDGSQFVRVSMATDASGQPVISSLSLCQISADGTTCTETPIDATGVAFDSRYFASWNGLGIDALALTDGVIFARIYSNNCQGAGTAGAYVWIDAATHKVIATKALFGNSGDVLLNVEGNAVVASSSGASPTSPTWWFNRMQLNGDAVAESFAVVQGDGSWPTERVFNAGDGFIAISNQGLTGGTHVRLYSERDINSLFNGSFDPTLFQNLTPVAQASLTDMVDEQGKTVYAPLWPSDARIANGKLYVAYVQHMVDESGGAAYPKPRVACFDMDGTLVWSSIFPESSLIASNASFALSVGSQGAIALEGIENANSGVLHEIIFISPDGTKISRNTNRADFGSWIGERWIALASTTQQVGDDWLNRTSWYLSKQVLPSTPGPDPTDPADPTDPGPTDPTDPTGPTGPTNPESPEGDAANPSLQPSSMATNAVDFADTGDDTRRIALAVAGLAFASCGIALVAFAVRKQWRRNE